jgi:hypothetical protein
MPEIVPVGYQMVFDDGAESVRSVPSVERKSAAQVACQRQQHSLHGSQFQMHQLQLHRSKRKKDPTMG